MEFRRVLFRSLSPAMITTGMVSSWYRLRSENAAGIISAASAALARNCEGRRLIHVGYSILKRSDTGAGPNALRSIPGHMARPIKGDTVKRIRQLEEGR